MSSQLEKASLIVPSEWAVFPQTHLDHSGIRSWRAQPSTAPFSYTAFKLLSNSNNHVCFSSSLWAVFMPIVWVAVSARVWRRQEFRSTPAVAAHPSADIMFYLSAVDVSCAKTSYLSAVGGIMWSFHPGSSNLYLSLCVTVSKLYAQPPKLLFPFSPLQHMYAELCPVVSAGTTGINALCQRDCCPYPS